VVNRILFVVGRIWVAAVYLIIFIPLVLVVLISFSADSYLNFPPESWGMRWYGALLSDTIFVNAAAKSAVIAVVVTGVSLLVGIPAAYALARGRFRGRHLIQTLLMLPLLLPTIVLGLSILLVFSQLGLVATYPGIVLAHLMITLPFTVRILTTALSTSTSDLEDASATLGARPSQTFRLVTLPLLKPAMTAATALSMILSFDEVVLSLFLAGPKLNTLPVTIYRHVAERADPTVAVVAVVLIVLSVAVVLLLQRTIGFMRAFGR